jgi:hypothetical protein
MAALGIAQFRFQFSPSGEEGSKQAVMEDAGWISVHVPEDAVIGSFNAGRLGYYLPRRVVDLDGVVNGDVIKSLEDHTLDRYLVATKISYVLDKAGYVNFFFDRYAATGMNSLSLVRQMRVGTLYAVNAMGRPNE